MKVTSNYHKKLHCHIGDKSVGIEPNKIITVDNEIGKVLIENPWIHEAKEGTKTLTFGTKKPREKKIRKLVKKKDKILKENPIRQKNKGRI